MKTKKIIFSILFLTGITLTGFSQNSVIDVNDLRFIPENVLPDVNGKILISQDFANQVISEETKDGIEVFAGWPVIETGSSQRGGIYCNLDEDPDLEIVYCIGQSIHAWKTDGTIVPGWPQSLQLYPNGAPAFGDVDGDSEEEIVVSTATPGTGAQGRIFVFEKDGSTTSGFPVILGGGATKTPVLADLDGDDILEIIVEERSYPDGYVAVYKGDGSSFPGFPVMMDYIPASAVAVGDITGDNVPEIVAESYYSVYAYDINGNVLDGFPFTPGNSRVFSYSSPVLADLDGDGMREIIVGDHSLTAGNGAVHIIKNDGTVFSGWPKYVGSWIYGPPAVGDIDGDGNPDIAIGDQVLSGSPASRVYVWDKNGDYLSGWPTDLIWSVNNQILLTDFDGDNLIELIWDDNTGEGKYLGYNHDGTVLEGWPLPVQWSTFFMNPFVADVNNDGITDISGGGTDIENNTGCAIYLWDAGAEYHPEINVLPVLQYNVRHDGVYTDASVLNANFIATPLEICESGEVQFTNLSTGNIVSWVWSFEGGNPATSTDPDPLILYNNPGQYNVTLIVSDGTNSNTITKTDYIKVQYEAEIPGIPAGSDTIWNPPTNVAYYMAQSDNADSYVWELTPESAGVMVPGDTVNEIKIYWSQANSLLAELKVKAVNICGESDFSEPLTIYLNWTTGIENASGNKDISIFPNPSDGKFFIQSNNELNIIKISVLNSFCKPVGNLKCFDKKRKVSIDYSDLPCGLYYLIIETENSKYFEKVVFH